MLISDAALAAAATLPLIDLSPALACSTALQVNESVSKQQAAAAEIELAKTRVTCHAHAHPRAITLLHRPGRARPACTGPVNPYLAMFSRARTHTHALHNAGALLDIISFAFGRRAQSNSMDFCLGYL